jgi:hypothetical protein
MTAQGKYRAMAFASLLFGAGLLFFIFEWRYMWFVQGSAVLVLRIGFAVGLAVIVSIWTWYPSRILMVVAALGAVCFPIAVRLSDAFTGLLFWALVVVAIVVLDAAVRFRKKFVDFSGRS